MQFVVEFIKKPKEIGAIAPSSFYLAQKMTPQKRIDNAKVIVELGAGMGNFTKEIVRKKDDDCKLIVLETNSLFFTVLSEEYRSREDIIVLFESAENLPLLLQSLGIKNVDLIISGLPFSSLGIKMTRTILNGVKEVLGENGTFLTFQYSKYRINFFKRTFYHVTHERELRNLPPAYIFECRKSKGDME